MMKKDRELINEGAMQKLWYLLKNFEFMALLISLTSVYFITTGIQFWVTDYWVQVLG